MSDNPAFGPPQLRRTPAERAAAAVLPVSGMAWAAAEIMHWAGVHAGVDAGIGTALASAVAWGAAGRGRAPESLPWWIAITGGWFAAAESLGPLAWWPAPVLSFAWGVITAVAVKQGRQHESVVAAREWREQREEWLAWRARAWHLGGSHLLEFKQTRLGELYTVNIKGTGKKRSQILASSLAEHIAQEEDLDESRVRLMRHGPAGRIRISVRRTDPWASPILHPLACDEHEITLPERRSILDPAVVGQDPETGDLLTVPLYTEIGANRVSVTANSGGGKGVLEDNLFEHVTACDDAVAVHLNLSVKGYEDEECWGPACWLTAYGPERKARAAAVLKVIAAVLEWRAQHFRRGEYAPSPEHPAIIIFNDESDSALSALREEINVIVTKGRSHGAGYVRLGQRNTREYADPKARSQDNVRCTGLVQNSNEARHAGSGAGPDMSTYGEGKPGVWKVELLGGPMSLGRTWVFHRAAARHAAECARIAAERAYDQPELSGACREHLGSAYEALRATEVFERWARAQDPGAYPDDGGDAPAPEAPAPAAGQDTVAAPVTPAGRTALADRDPLEEMFRMDVDPGTQARINSIHEKLGSARRILEDAAAADRPAATDLEALAGRTAERWRQVDEQTEVPPDVRPRLLAMLEGGGTTAAAAATEFGVKRWKALTWLRVLRNEGLARTEGEKRGTRWVTAPPPEAGDA